jgi:chromosome segregation ATPase
MAENTEMVTEKDFSQEDIENVKDLQSKYAATTAQLGQVEIELHILNKRLEQMKSLREQLFERYDSLQKEETDLVKTLNDKYGDGVLDLDSGKFIPSKS